MGGDLRPSGAAVSSCSCLPSLNDSAVLDRTWDSTQVVETDTVVPEDPVLCLIGDRQSQQLFERVWIVGVPVRAVGRPDAMLSLAVRSTTCFRPRSSSAPMEHGRKKYALGFIAKVGASQLE